MARPEPGGLPSRAGHSLGGMWQGDESGSLGSELTLLPSVGGVCCPDGAALVADLFVFLCWDRILLKTKPNTGQMLREYQEPGAELGL